ncbi:MAG TPA: DUF5103 domain-containing protein [Williamwhitmania sp.]|nr:DUF5103 domain-containing protein [Williamwhitmania sp.]
MKAKYILFLSCLTALSLPTILCYANNNIEGGNVLCGSEKNGNFTTRNDICTVQIYPEGFELGDPILELNATNPLIFSFDQIGDTPDYFTYTIVHCDANWNESGLYYADYMDGFQTNTLNDYQYSFNTKVNYIHFSLKLPNNQVQIKLSGNYVIRVYGPDSSTEPIIQKCFYVVEQLTTLALRLRQASDPSLAKTHQQLDLEVFYNSLQITDPITELKVVAIQDDIPAKQEPQPVFIHGNSVVYSNTDQLLFNGLNEWRTFDTRSLNYNSINVDEISFVDDKYHVLLKTDKSREFSKYMTQPDFDGKTAIQAEKGYNPDIDLDYPIIYFTLAAETPLFGDVYVVGDFTNFSCDDRYKMIYNPERKSYELALQLKQGYYDYMYAFREKGSNELNLTALEGSHSEAQNTYTVYVYYRPTAGRYDRLVGFARIGQ